MTKSELRIKEAVQYFDNKDVMPGFRRLLDCVTDTQDMNLYREAIDLTDWKEHHENETQSLIDQSKILLQKVATIPVREMQAGAPTVIAIDLQKSYGVGKFALGPVSLSISKGQVYGLVGENGNGKTTLLRMLAKEIDISSGNISYNFEQPVASAFDLRTKLVYIPQRTKKWYGSLLDNLKFVLTHYGCIPEENEARTLMMIARFGLWKYKDLKWNELSSGYKMRFELARTLLRRPEILLLDEPLANLDIVSQQLILEDLKSIANSASHPIALILSSQQLYEVEKISDKVIFLRNGKYTDNNASKAEGIINELIVEIDSANSKEELNQILGNIGMTKLIFNGGVYVATFDASVSFAAVLETLGRNACSIAYIRNISSSTRRFFVNQ